MYGGGVRVHPPLTTHYLRVLTGQVGTAPLKLGEETDCHLLFSVP